MSADIPLNPREKQLLQEYHELCHAMQTGVKIDQESGRSPDGSPKHLRVGLNTSKADHAALVQLLIAKGVFTREEYFEYLHLMMVREVVDYEKRVQGVYHTNKVGLFPPHLRHLRPRE